MRRLVLAVVCALGLVAGGVQAATYEEPRLTAREVASRAEGVVRIAAESTSLVGDHVIMRIVTNGVADVDRHTARMRVEVEMTAPLGMAPHDVVTTRGRLYLRSTGDWVTFPLDAGVAPGLVSDPLAPLTALARASAWRRVSPSRYAGRDETLPADLDVTVDWRGRPVAVAMTTDGLNGGRTTIRLTLREYGVPERVEVPAGARPVKDLDEALGVLGL